MKSLLLLRQELLDALCAHVAAASDPGGVACSSAAVSEELRVVVDDVLFIDLAQRRLFLRIGYDTVSLLMCRSSTLRAKAIVAHSGVGQAEVGDRSCAQVIASRIVLPFFFLFLLQG